MSDSTQTKSTMPRTEGRIMCQTYRSLEPESRAKASPYSFGKDDTAPAKITAMYPTFFTRKKKARVSRAKPPVKKSTVVPPQS